MKKIYSLIIALFLLQQSAFAQKINVNWGPELKSRAWIETGGVVGLDKSGFYSLAFQPGMKSVALQKYNNKQELINTSEIVLSANSPGSKSSFVGAYKVQDSFMFFSLEYDKDANNTALYANKVSMAGKAVEKPVKISQFDGLKSNELGVSITLSYDSSKVLIFSREYKKKKEKEGFNLKVIDKEINTLWEKEIAFEKANKDVNISQYVLDNKGNAFVLLSTKKDMDERNSGESHWYKSVLGYYYEKDELKEYKVELPGKFIKDSQFKVNTHGNVIVAGLYGNKPGEYSSGVFFMRLNSADQKVESQTIQEFSDEFLLQYSNGKKKGLKGVYGLTIKDIALREDQGAVVICEVAYSIEYTTQRKSGGMSTKVVHYNGPILVVNIKPSGDIAWVTSIFKWQKGTFDMFHSFAYLIKGDKLYFMYNDHEDNLDKYSIKKLKWLQGKGSTVGVMAIVDGSGKYVKANLFNAKDYKTVFLPRQFFHSESKNIIYSTIFGFGASKYRFGTVSIN